MHLMALPLTIRSPARRAVGWERKNNLNRDGNLKARVMTPCSVHTQASPLPCSLCQWDTCFSVEVRCAPVTGNSRRTVVPRQRLPLTQQQQEQAGSGPQGPPQGIALPCSSCCQGQWRLPQSRTHASRSPDCQHTLVTAAGRAGLGLQQVVVPAFEDTPEGEKGGSGGWGGVMTASTKYQVT